MVVYLEEGNGVKHHLNDTACSSWPEPAEASGCRNLVTAVLEVWLPFICLCGGGVASEGLQMIVGWAAVRGPGLELSLWNALGEAGREG